MAAVDRPTFISRHPTPTCRCRDSDGYNYGLKEDLVMARPAGMVHITPLTAKSLSKDQLNENFESPEFKVHPSFPVCHLRC
jgi:hypothetical protein